MPLKTGQIQLLCAAIWLFAGTAANAQPASPRGGQKENCIKKVVCGGDFCCVLAGDRMLFCWGGNRNGQFGDGTKESAAGPTVFELDHRVVDLTAGSAHMYSLASDGKVRCWGSNEFGQIGLNTSAATGNEKPGEVPGLKDVVKVVAGYRHSCAIEKGGGVKCWGEMMGAVRIVAGGERIPPTLFRVPVRIQTDGACEDFSAGWGTCCLTKRKEVKCWGDMITVQPSPDPASDLNCNKSAACIQRTKSNRGGRVESVHVGRVKGDHLLGTWQGGFAGGGSAHI
jgi:hypothetical protein